MRIALCSTAEVPDEGGLRVETAHTPALAVFRVRAAFFVTDDTCTHAQASLADGIVEGLEIVCPFHQGRFDLATGAPTASPCKDPLRTYYADVVEDTVYIDIEP